MSGTQRVVDLGDPASERGRREVEHALPLERLGERADLVHQPAADERRVVGELLVTDVDVLKHRRPRIARRRSEPVAGSSVAGAALSSSPLAVAGRSPSTTGIATRSPSRTTVKLAVCPGRRPVATIRTRSSLVATASPSMATTTSPPARNVSAVHRDLPIARPQAGALGGAAGNDALDRRAALDGESRARRASDARERLRRDPDPRVAHLAGLDQLLHRRGGRR